MTVPRCKDKTSPTCVLPSLRPEPHTCAICGRVWRRVRTAPFHGYFWMWNGEYAKEKP